MADVVAVIEEFYGKCCCLIGGCVDERQRQTRRDGWTDRQTKAEPEGERGGGEKERQSETDLGKTCHAWVLF